MSDLGRWWIYQRERFPLARTGALVAAFAFSAVALSGYLRGRAALPSLTGTLVAFVTSLGFFALLRIADEHKDFDEDSQFRPYRPVPRGLVKLSELRAIGFTIAAVQMALALWLAPQLAFLLLLTWGYFGLMTKEFFIRDWLKARPLAYLFSHMLIMPLIDLYATACDWMPALGMPPEGLGWFLLMSFFNGIVIEVGRKLRAPEDEEAGVETYTSLYGRGRATAGLLAAMAGAGASAVAAASLVNAGLAVLAVLLVAYALVLVTVARFLRRPVAATATRLEPISGTWVLVSYIALATLPLAVGR